MTRIQFALGATFALGLLGGCHAEVHKQNGAKAGVDAGNVSAEGKAEEGKFSLNAPGFNMKVDLPASIADHASVDANSDLLYPGSRLGGLHVEAGDDGDHNDGGVELRFASSDDPARIAAWYRDPARANDFVIDSAKADADATMLTGHDKDGETGFTVHLSPAAGGGTDGRLTIADRS
jgi:hypothetical protein